jgi:hypothetical protein
VLAGHLEWDLEQSAVEHSDFPRRTTGDQFYDEWDSRPIEHSATP